MTGAVQSALWKVLRRKVLFADSPHIELSAEDVELPDGRVVESYYQIGSRPSCAVVGTTQAGELIMVRQYKHGARKVCLTFPGGRLEEGETLMDTAKRELREETGYEGDHWRSLGRFPIHANQRVGECELFRCENARQVVAAKPGDLEDMEVVLVSEANARVALASGEIGLLGDAAALGLALSENPNARLWRRTG
ncbi:MAG: NUDIX hydrolase [Novosphingobium sp.]|nr:NUDIX hydrolase [Novosphingobium sp.]